MESNHISIEPEKRKFQLFEHPWLSLLAVMATSIFSIALVGTIFYGWIGLSGDAPTTQFAQMMTYYILTVFILVPFVLHLPKGKRTFRQYLDDIGLSRVHPFIRLALLGLSCYVILALSQVAASVIYRLSEGLTLNGLFIRQVFGPSRDLPPGSPSLLTSFPSIFEEMVFRGVVLTVFLGRYSERKSILFSSAAFGLMHALNLLNGSDLVWTMSQVVSAFIMGLFYGYAFVRTRSLLPPMIVHYLGNVFISTLVGYLQVKASIEVQALYGVILSLSIVAVTLMILWTRYFTSRWLAGSDARQLQDVEEAARLQPAVYGRAKNSKARFKGIDLTNERSSP
jgi:membrane protease YdiL (CAAX protease family)